MKETKEWRERNSWVLEFEHRRVTGMNGIEWIGSMRYMEVNVVSGMNQYIWSDQSNPWNILYDFVVGGRLCFWYIICNNLSGYHQIIMMFIYSWCCFTKAGKQIQTLNSNNICLISERQIENWLSFPNTTLTAITQMLIKRKTYPLLQCQSSPCSLNTLELFQWHPISQRTQKHKTLLKKSATSYTTWLKTQLSLTQHILEGFN